MSAKQEQETVHTVTVVLRIRSRSPVEAIRKVRRVLSVITHWPRGAWEVEDVRPGWRPVNNPDFEEN